ncbi:MAG: hypothetical protein CMK59_10015 [Proteobacteria bacterium]|nr:hypothetical protein [Pseudomonadota bacterium]
MRSFAELLEEQKSLELRFEDFHRSLDQSRTVTLRQLFTESNPLIRLNAPWINIELLKKRLTSMCSFFERLGNHSRLIHDNPRLIFVQSSPEQEDFEMFQKLNEEDELFKERLIFDGRGDDLPPQYLYLHTNPMWCDIDGDWDEGNRRIRPLYGCSNNDYSSILKEAPEKPIFANVLGLRIPDWPKWLNVSADIATDYLARTIIHDIGHEILPRIHPKNDGLHNAVMIYAAQCEPLEYSNLWEKIVHQESTDPFFFIRGHTLLQECNPQDLTPLNRYLFRRMKGWYATPRHERKNAHLWDIDSSWPLSKQIQIGAKAIEHMMSDGFVRYDREPM